MKRLPSLPPWLWGPLVLGADFLTKRLVIAHADTLRGGVPLLGDLARLSYVRTPGAAMGLFHNGRWLLVAVSAGTSALLVWLYWRASPRQRRRRAAYAAILGGALGNLVDRVFYGGLVVDFLDLGWGPHRFYTFNVADMGVTLGGVALFLAVLGEGRAQRRAAGEVASAAAPADAAQGENDGRG